MDNQYNDGVEEEFTGTQESVAAPNAEKPITRMIEAVEPPEDLLDLDSVLRHTQKIRVAAQKTIMRALNEGVDSEMLNVLLKTAKDMDAAVVSRRRVGIEEEASKTAEQTQRDTAAILKSLASQANAFRVDPSQVDPNRTVPSLGNDVPPVEGVPGEMDQGQHQFSYDGFAKDLPG